MASADGRTAERLALAYLQARGLVHIESNWRCRFGEIDLVLRDGDTIVFVEVRLRTGNRHGGAAESIDPGKRRRLLAAARAYLAGSRETACRFDVVLLAGVRPPRLEWIRDALSET